MNLKINFMLFLLNDLKVKMDEWNEVYK